MRSPLLASLLLALALLALPAVAAAGPKPIKKPDAPAKTATPPAKAPVTPRGKTPVAPTHTTQTPRSSSTHTATNTTPIEKPSSTGTSGTGTSTANTQVGGAGTVTPKIVSVNIVGRDQSGAEITLPPTDVTPPVAAPDPTPLALVSVGDRIRSHSTATPAWMLALLAALAALEAFLVVRLLRNRSRTGGGISTAS